MAKKVWLSVSIIMTVVATDVMCDSCKVTGLHCAVRQDRARTFNSPEGDSLLFFAVVVGSIMRPIQSLDRS